MEKEKAEKIIRIINWIRILMIALLLIFIFAGLGKG